jgi:hypothetical protein
MEREQSYFGRRPLLPTQHAEWLNLDCLPLDRVDLVHDVHFFRSNTSNGSSRTVHASIRFALCIAALERVHTKGR